MKKLTFFLVILLILVAGAQLFTSNAAKSQIDAYIAMLENSQNLNIESKDIKHNIFGSQIDLKLLANVFDEKVEFNLNFNNSYVILPQFSKVEGNLSAPYKGIKNLFGTQTPITFKAKMGFSKSEIIMNIAPVSIDEKFKINESIASLFLRGDKFKAFELEMPEISIEDEDFKTQLSGVKYYVNYDEPVNIDDISKKIFDSTAGMSIDNIVLNSMVFAVKFNDLFFDTKIVKNLNKYNIISNTNIKNMDLFKIKIDDIVLDFYFNNIDVKATERLCEFDEKKMQNDLLVNNEISKLIDNTSNFELRNFGFKANDGEVKLNLKLALHQNYTQEKFTDIKNYLLLDGEFSASKPLSAMFGALGAEFKAIEQSALSSGMLKESGDGYNAIFKMRENKFTINGIEQNTSFLDENTGSDDAKTMEKMYEDFQN